MLDTVWGILLDEYSIGQWAMVFFLCSFAGWCWEVGLYVVKERRFVNRGFLTGPILPIYGFGALCVLLLCLPFKENVLLVALVGTLSASLMEYVTGYVMEALFHVRYWDYSQHVLNLHGYICLMSAVTWAVFSVFIVCVVHPFFHPLLSQIPPTLAAAASGTLALFAVIDTGFAVHRALDLRALLESMERYARELEALHGGLDGINERIRQMIRAFAEQVDLKQEELSGYLEPVTTARDRVMRMIDEKRISISDGVRERFNGFETILTEAASYLPDVSSLRREVEEAKARFDRQSELLRQERMRRLTDASKTIKRNPSAASPQYQKAFEALKQEEAAQRFRRRKKAADGQTEPKQNQEK